MDKISTWWKDAMKASGGLNEGGWFENNSSWKVGNGKVVRLWNYKWGGQQPIFV